MRRRVKRQFGRRGRRGFTLVEVMVAGIITAMVVGSLSMCLGQLGRAKDVCKRRFDAHVRADAALSAIRKDVISIIRTDDLFYTRFYLYNSSVNTEIGLFGRAELTVFNTRLRPVRRIDAFNGEGQEYETQYRIIEDQFGPVLWRRRDALPDEYPMGGGVASPVVEGVLGIEMEAFDGDRWWDAWDSDYDGIPHAVRITVTASGHRDDEDVWDEDTPTVTLRTVVAIDRVATPRDHYEDYEALLDELEAEEQAEGIEDEFPTDDGTGGIGGGAGGTGRGPGGGLEGGAGGPGGVAPVNRGSGGGPGSSGGPGASGGPGVSGGGASGSGQGQSSGSNQSGRTKQSSGGDT
jgi:uncharacterized membrane protein YgcG